VKKYTIDASLFINVPRHWSIIYVQTFHATTQKSVCQTKVIQYTIRLLYGWQTATILRHKMKK